MPVHRARVEQQKPDPLHRVAPAVAVQAAADLLHLAQPQEGLVEPPRPRADRRGADGEARRPTSVDDRGCVFLG